MENDSENELFRPTELNDWHLSDHMDDSPMMRSQSLPASDLTADRSGLVQLQLHEEPDAEQPDDAESSGGSQMGSDQHRPNKLWREYHPLLTGK